MILQAAYEGSLVADAHAMPVHWYYDRAALSRDFPNLDHYQAPLGQHPDSILWRSAYSPVNAGCDILHEEAGAWGQKNIHYHRHLQAGENTVNFKLAAALYQQILSQNEYSAQSWAELYVKLMLTPSWHGDTYLEEYHRGFFTRYGQGKNILKCGIRDEHIGGLSQVPAIVSALSGRPIADIRRAVKIHVTLTHRHSNVLRAADCLARLLVSISEGIPLREAIMQAAGDWFSTKKAQKWESRSDRQVVGQVFSPACYIDQSFPAALYIAWKYHDDFRSGVIANTLVGGDNCHRGAVVGSLLAAETYRIHKSFDASYFGVLLALEK